MRTCNRCKIKKDPSNFQKDRTSNGGLSTVCRDCKNEISKERYKKKRIAILQRMAEKRRANPGWHRDKGKRSYLKHKDSIVIRRMIKRNENPDVYRNYWLKQKYGITVEEYNAIYSRQNGKCFLCGTHSSELTKPLCVDHCHSTGKVRSLLCTNCNTGLGQFKENTALMKRAISYLTEHLA